MTLDLGGFRIQDIFLEVRYSPLFRLWDRAGAIGTGLQERHPKMKLADGKPNIQTFQLTDQLTADVRLDRAILGENCPDPKVEQFKATADHLFSLIVQHLEPKEFERIGLRVIFAKAFREKLEAASYLKEVLPYANFEGKFFNIEQGRLMDGETMMRWEGDTLGCTIRLQTQERVLEFSAPKEFEVNSVDKRRRTVLVDVDYYAHAPTQIGKFRPSAIIESWMPLIRRDVPKILDV